MHKELLLRFLAGVFNVNINQGKTNRKMLATLNIAQLSFYGDTKIT